MIRFKRIIILAAFFPGLLSAGAQGFKLQTLYAFSASPRNPQAGLVLEPDGNLYGTTYGGGVNSYGTVFKITTNGVLTTLAAFNPEGGQNPFGGLARGMDGLFYGTTYIGGGQGYGTIFQVATNGGLNLVAAFAATNGANPEAGLIQASDGNFYGTTTFGGTNGYGAIFRFMTNGALTAPVSFNNTNGAYPQDSLVQGTDGGLYGTAYGGGVNSNGTIFKFTTNGILTVLDSFGGTTNPCDTPVGGLVQGRDGFLYGTTTRSVLNGDNGAVFKVSTNGSFTLLAAFDNTNNGAQPEACLIQGMDGYLYGTASSGGSNGFGTVFKISTNSASPLSVLVSFNNTNGAYPRSALVQTPDGYLYGTTQAGGTNGGGGTVFKVSTNGAFASLISFNTDGTVPEGTLALGTNGAFYGTTYGGGSNDFGSVFKITPAGALTTVASFAGTNGANPFAGVLPARDGNFYGTTVLGGTNAAPAYGTVFKVTPSGALTSLASFNIANGAYPYSALCQTPDGSFYGTTSQGGTNNSYGTIFKLASNGTLTAPVSFNGADGGYPYGNLLLAADGNLYGTTEGDDMGTYPQGTVFQFNTNNNALNTLVGFDFNHGSYPFGGLIQGADGYLYGATYSGGAFPNYGAVFQIPTTAVFTNVLGSFNNANGANPDATLLAGPNGAFYGTTFNGGTYNNGTVFKITTNGILTSLVSFNGVNGANPDAGLTLGSDGNFYGATEFGGTGGGTIFRLLPEPAFTNIVHLANGNIVLSGAGGPFSQKFRLWSSGNITLPFISWTLVASNSFDAGGNFTAADASAPPTGNRFYRITIP